MADAAQIFEPAAAAASLGIVSTPIGTMDEIRAQGLDPSMVACCAPPSADGTIRGCPVFASCRFHEVKRGGFKGKGPRYIGYYLRTSRSDRGRQKNDVIACYNYVRVLQHREAFGRSQKDAGKDHETIRVIRQEGQKITVQRWERNAPDGGNRSNDITMRTWPEEITVPVFPRPGQNPAITYQQQLAAEESERQALEDGDDIEIVQHMSAMATASPDEESVLDADAAATEPSPDAVLARPKPRKL